MGTIKSEWVTAAQAWDSFVNDFHVLNYKSGRGNFHNFLRNGKTVLVNADAIRKAKGKYWIAHETRFKEVAFEIATNNGNVATPFHNSEDFDSEGAV